jgi:hypothetical protein
MDKFNCPRRISERLRSDPRLIGAYRKARRTYFFGDFPAVLGKQEPLWPDEASPVRPPRQRYVPLPIYRHTLPRKKTFSLTIPLGFVAHFDRLDDALTTGLSVYPDAFSVSRVCAGLEVAEFPRLAYRGGKFCVNLIEDDFFAEIHWGTSFPRATNHNGFDPPVSNTMQGRFLVDWSASHSLISSRILRYCGLQRIWTLPMACGGEAQIELVDQVDASAFVLGPVRESGSLFPAISVLAANFADVDVDGVIGRDLLMELPWASKLFQPLSERQLQHNFAYGLASPSIKWP